MKKDLTKVRELYDYLVEHPDASYEQMEKISGKENPNSLVKYLQRHGHIQILPRERDEQGRFYPPIKKCLNRPGGE